MNLGQVFGITDVFVNQQPVGVKWFGRRIYDLSSFLKPGKNELEIRLTTTMGNYLKTLKENENAQYWVNRPGREQEIQSMGIVGLCNCIINLKSEIMKRLLTLIMCLCCLQVLAKDYDVKDFGVEGNGTTLNTRSIQAAIDYVSTHGEMAAWYLPRQLYVTGTIYMKSNVILHLERGASILGSLNPWDYDKDPYINWKSLIYAIKQENIGITGQGSSMVADSIMP